MDIKVIVFLFWAMLPGSAISLKGIFIAPNVAFSKFIWFSNINNYQVNIKGNIHGQFVWLNIDDQVNFLLLFPIVKSTLQTA